MNVLVMSMTYNREGMKRNRVLDEVKEYNQLEMERRPTIRHKERSMTCHRLSLDYNETERMIIYHSLICLYFIIH